MFSTPVVTHGLGVLQPAGFQTGGRGHGPPHSPGGQLAADRSMASAGPRPRGQEQKLKPPCGGGGRHLGSCRRRWRAQGCGCCRVPSTPACGSWALGEKGQLGASPISWWGQTLVSRAPCPQQHERCPRGHSLVGAGRRRKAGREAWWGGDGSAVSPPVLGRAMTCWLLRGLAGTEGPERPAGAAGCRGAVPGVLGQAPGAGLSASPRLAPQTRHPARAKLTHEFRIP